ncbi:MAG: 23S rRNA (uracil(1939)-C(5))-methyltransferase RlmD [Clostridia bacterium]|nr:23S rRNA (uracil(1939)-C(5))-methyltransferase RlmD [Clostridia bacterium]
MSLKKNQNITLKIEDITNLGFGVGRYGGEVVFVSDTVPLDEVECTIIKPYKSYSIARPTRYIKYSPDRCDSRCQSKLCRACSYKHLSYERECEIKRSSVVSAFNKVGLPEVEVGELIPSPSLTSYRNKAQYPISRGKGGEYIIGFFAPKSHRVAEACDCPLAPSVFSDILKSLKEFFKANDLSVYDEESGKGLLRHIYLRRGEVSGEILLTLVINGSSIPNEVELCEKITREFPEVVGILTNENRKNTNVILGDTVRTLYGRDYIFDTLAGVKLKITAQSFYQVNHGAAELLYGKAKELCELTGDELLLDLYCGAGSIGLSMIDGARELCGIEIVESAVECAKFNAEINGAKNASFYTGDASSAEKILDGAEKIRGEKIKPDIVILDPPRAGSTRELLSFVASLSPKKIVYISCNPETLARDCVTLIEHGFSPSEITPFDLFPATGHVESVVCLKRQIQQ